jgi:hypothetical protein
MNMIDHSSTILFDDENCNPQPNLSTDSFYNRQSRKGSTIKFDIDSKGKN